MLECEPEPRLSRHHIVPAQVADSTLAVLVVVVALVSRIDPETHMSGEGEGRIAGELGLVSVTGLEHIQTLVAEAQQEPGTVPGPEVPHELGYETVVLVVGSWLYRGCTKV